MGKKCRHRQKAKKMPTPQNITATSSNHQFSLPLDENDHRYVGLVNQAMTCYLNSLVQSLYMTPEFRNAMYEWEYIQQPNSIKEQKKKAESSIPCQLQKLFLLLQTSENDSLETKDLTQSFGWTSNEAYEQHDVQELCRLMFDALEHKWKGTKHEKLIQDLYRGSMENVVSCLKCGYKSVKKDYFLDLSLALKPFESMHAYKSVEEALTAFVQPELLDGSNQYMCESCKSKQDARKELRITQFPYLLTIQLKRTGFDYNTMHRIKLNDKMTFPDVLDLNEYVIKKEKEKPDEAVVSEAPKSAWKTIPKKENAEEEEEDDMELGSPNPKRYTPGSQSPNRYDANGEEIFVGQPINHKSVERIIKTRGENVYELFSVMVHSGNAAGGHYFAYIKNLDQDKWYVFNDTRVDFATPMDIEKSFGGHPMGWDQSDTSAYMLMYRKIDRKRNASFILTNKLPRHIKNSQEKWKQMEQEAEKERLRRMNLLQVHVTINYPFPSYVKLPDKSIKDLTSQKEQIAADFALYRTEISREQPIEAIFNQSYSYFSEKLKMYNLPHSKNAARLIYSEHNHMVMDYKSPAEMKKKIRSVFNPNLSEPGPMYVVHFVLDVKISSIFFNLDIQNKVTIRVQRVDVGKRTTANELMMVLQGDAPLLRVKQWIGSMFRDDIHATCAARMFMETASNRVPFMKIGTDFNAWEFRAFVNRYVGNAIPTFYYDGGIQTMVTKESAEATKEDRKIQDFQKTVMYQILDRKCFSTYVKVRLPSEEDVKKANTTANAYQGPSWAETEASMKKEDRTWDQPRVSTAAEISSTVSKNETQDANNLETEADDEPIPSGRLDEAQLEGKSQIMVDYMQKKIYAASQDPSLFGAKDESISAVSSGQSTLVPSTSNQFRSLDDTGKIHVISSSEDYHRLDIDSRMAVREFKKWVAEKLGISEERFVIYKHNTDDGSDNGYESCMTDEESVAYAFQSCFISIKLRAPLKSDQKLIPIMLLDMKESKENFKMLFEIPASPTMVIGDVLLQCLRMYKEHYGEELTLQMVRFREIHQGSIQMGRAVLNPNDKFNTRLYWNQPLNLQIIDDELIGKPGEAMLVRRFRPSTVEVSPVHEVLFDGDTDCPAAEFVEAISKHSGIPVERVAVMEHSDYEGTKWPYVKSHLEMLESKSLFSKDFPTLYSGRDFFEKMGSKILHYKDSDEEAKILTEDERKKIKIKKNGKFKVREVDEELDQVYYTHPKSKDYQKIVINGRKKFNQDPWKALDWLASRYIVAKDPQALALWMKAGEGLSKNAIGEILGDNRPFALETLDKFTKEHRLHDVPIVPALRQYLFSFRLPGESQKINRILEKFAEVYVQQNPAYGNADQAHTVAYSCIMGNTLLHNPNVKDEKLPQVKTCGSARPGQPPQQPKRNDDQIDMHLGFCFARPDLGDDEEKTFLFSPVERVFELKTQVLREFQISMVALDFMVLMQEDEELPENSYCSDLIANGAHLILTDRLVSPTSSESEYESDLDIILENLVE